MNATVRALRLLASEEARLAPKPLYAIPASIATATIKYLLQSELVKAEWHKVDGESRKEQAVYTITDKGRNLLK